MSQSFASKVKSLFFKTNNVAATAVNVNATVPTNNMKPSPAAVFQAAKILKPHVPSIKFRYGSGAAVHSGISASAPAPAARGTPAAGGGSSPTKPNATIARPTIEDWQLPARYRRRPIDEQEVNCINQGGAL